MVVENKFSQSLMFMFVSLAVCAAGEDFARDVPMLADGLCTLSEKLVSSHKEYHVDISRVGKSIDKVGMAGPAPVLGSDAQLKLKVGCQRSKENDIIIL